MQLISYTDLSSFMQLNGLPKRSRGGIIYTVREWLSSMGPEATVDRLKALKTMLLTGSAPSCATWIAIGRDGRPKGHFGFLWRRDNVTLQQALRVVTVLYSSFVAQSVTRRQSLKFLESAHRGMEMLPYITNVSELEARFPRIEEMIDRPLSDFANKVRKAGSSARFDSIDNWISSPCKRSPVYIREVGWKNVVESSVTLHTHLDSILMMRFSEAALPLDLPDGFHSLSYKTAMNLPDSVMGWDHLAPPISGTISVIQERGMKARIIANPLRLHQIALSRFGNFLYSLIRQLDWDCTYDQSKGVDFVSQSLRSGKTVFCHDLSDASNHFPLAFQNLVLNCMRELVPEPYYHDFPQDVATFNYVARGRWILPKDLLPIATSLKMLDPTGHFRWDVGQPLGLFPSYPLFALSHGLLIRQCEYMTGVSNTFRVLGDDVVINHPEVSRLYTRYVTDILGVPISKEKSLTSSVIGEFAGKIITRDGPLDVEKWKTKGFLPLIKWIGPSAIQLFAPPWARGFLHFAVNCPTPLGFGMNPKGIPFDQLLIGISDLYFESLSPNDVRPLRVDRHLERRLESRDAFELGNNPATPYSQPESRKEVQDPVEIDHVNALIRMTSGYLPDKIKSWWKILHDKSRSKTRFTQQKPAEKLTFLDGRFLYLYKYWKRNRKRIVGERSAEIKNSG